MRQEFSYIPKDQRKKILLLCDDIRVHSGVATMAREIVIGTAHHFNWVNIGAAVKHPEQGRFLDISQDVNKNAGIEDADVKILPTSGYGDAKLLRSIIEKESPDGIFIFTDPRYWVWLFDMEREVRKTMPIFYLNIWDDYPAPLYNKAYYESCDVLMAISKQTKNINEIVLGEQAENKVIRYVPHGINPKFFFPIDKKSQGYAEFQKIRNTIFEGKDIEFVVFWNSRNIRRKSPGDVILSYRQFCDNIGKEKAKKCALIMHTQPVDQNGTDLYATREAICDPEYVNVFFSSEKLSTPQMNMLYNIADVTMLISSNEGWGLSLTESMMAGTPIIANVTGGMQDQMRFTKEGKWVDFTPDFPSNNFGTLKDHGRWASPVYPSNISLVGSVPTPYIYDDRCDFRDVAKAIEYWYNMPAEERAQRGMEGREWVVSEEAGMSTPEMCYRVMEAMTEGFNTFTPRPPFDFHKVESLPKNYIEHKLVY